MVLLQTPRRGAASRRMALVMVLALLVSAFGALPRVQAAPPRDEIVHVVRRGDTLAQIARQYRVTVAQLMAWNGIADPNMIRSGQRLIIRTAMNSQAAAGTAPAQPATSGSGATTSPAAAAGAPAGAGLVNLFGIAGNGLKQGLIASQDFRALGIQWVRWQVDWAVVEPTRTEPPSYHWNKVDEQMLNLTGAGLRPLVIVSTNPDWAASTTCGPHDKLADETPFVQFVQALVERYDGDGDYNGDGAADGAPLPNIREWEFYNEPDWDDKEWNMVGGCWGRHAKEYAQMLRAVHPVAHAANPTVRVVLGGIAGEDIGVNTRTGQPHFAFSRHGSAQANNDFMRQILAAGAGPYFDALNFHHYAAFDKYWASWGVGIQGKINWLNERLAAAKVSPKPVLVSETGLRSDPTPIDGVPGSLDEQARFVVKTHARAASAGVETLIWFTYQDLKGEAWGLIDSDGKPKPAYATYSRTIGFLRGASLVSSTATPGVESHRFRTAAGRPLTVAWAAAAGVPARLTIPAREVQVTRYDGQTANIRDGQAGDEDGRANGSIVTTVDDAPRFVETMAP
jgi:murein DD-endopeptidase MepM/ murein hydrolase activator NlpD